MKVSVSLFAAAKELVGCDRIELQVMEGATLATVQSVLSEQYPQLVPLMNRSMWAMDCQWVDDQTPVHPGADIGLIPPVSGG